MNSSTTKLVWGFAALMCVWAAAALSSYQTQTWVDTLNVLGIFLLGAAVLVLGGGAARLSGTAAGRLGLAGIFSAAAVALCPMFHVRTFGAWNGLDQWSKAGIFAPVMIFALLWVVSLFGKDSARASGKTAAERLEMFLCSGSARANLFWLTLIVVPAAGALGGMPWKGGLAALTFFVVLLLASRVFLMMAGTTVGAKALGFAPVFACGFAALMGLNEYRALRSDVALTKQMLAVDPGKSKEPYDRAEALSLRLHAPGPRAELDEAVARYFESQNNWIPAAAHWTKVAVLKKVSGEKFPPLQRVLCAQGDSLLAWRRFVFEGFDSINTPELAPGIQRLGLVAADVRGKLLAALLAWERKEPEAARKRLLEDAQLLSPGEPTSYALLKRMGGTPAPLKDASMWLPIELFVGKKTSQASINGTIEELGEIGTVVYLEEGHYEMSLRASGTPLHEEWPVVRVELNGQVLGPTQVHKAVAHDVPFTFDVKRRDLFSLRVIFQNHKTDLEEGRIARRGLTVFGIKFRQGKE